MCNRSKNDPRDDNCNIFRILYDFLLLIHMRQWISRFRHFVSNAQVHRQLQMVFIKHDGESCAYVLNVTECFANLIWWLFHRVGLAVFSSSSKIIKFVFWYRIAGGPRDHWQKLTQLLARDAIFQGNLLRPKVIGALWWIRTCFEISIF